MINKYCIYLRCTTWFDTHIQNKTIIAVKLIYPSPQSVTIFLLVEAVVRAPKIYSQQISSIQYSVIDCCHHTVHQVSRLIHSMELPLWGREVGEMGRRTGRSEHYCLGLGHSTLWNKGLEHLHSKMIKIWDTGKTWTDYFIYAQSFIQY